MYIITKVSILINTFYSVPGTMTQSIHSGRLEDIICISLQVRCQIINLRNNEMSFREMPRIRLCCILSIVIFGSSNRFE